MNRFFIIGLLAFILAPRISAQDAVDDSWINSLCQKFQAKPIKDSCSRVKGINSDLGSKHFLSSKILPAPSEGGKLGVYYHRKNSLIVKVTVSYIGAMEKSDYGFYYHQGQLLVVTHLHQKYDAPRTLPQAKIKEKLQNLFLKNNGHWVKQGLNDRSLKAASALEKQRIEAIHASIKRTIIRLEGPKLTPSQ